jgi:hypothetical protein
MRITICVLLLMETLFLAGCEETKKADLKAEADSFRACQVMALQGFRHIADTRDKRFEGKVQEATALCRGGQNAVQFMSAPWVDWTNYWATGDSTSLTTEIVPNAGHLGPNGRGLDGALLDLEYQRIELIKFNLFDNNGTYEDYVKGRAGVGGPALKTWPEMRLPKDHPNYQDAGGDGEQICKGELIRSRTLTGICNDIRNPLMGSTGQLFARNVELDTTFPDLGMTEWTRNRHGDRLSLLKPDPQVISRKLFTRNQSKPDACRAGYVLPGDSMHADCDRKKAPSSTFWRHSDSVHDPRLVRSSGRRSQPIRIHESRLHQPESEQRRDAVDGGRYPETGVPTRRSD